MQANLPDTARHCAYCGHPIADDAPMPERFGGMSFMMRGMTSTRHQHGTAEVERTEERRRA